MRYGKLLHLSFRSKANRATYPASPYSDGNYARIGWCPNYIGTINNLSTPITKTAAQTMRIIYTLTDVDE